MSEVNIRINKRVFERVIFSVIIIGLLVFMFLQPAGEVDTEQVSDLEQQVSVLEQQNENLSSQISSLQEQLSTAQQELEVVEQEEITEPAPAPEPVEPALSGELNFSFDASTSSGELNAFTVSVDNGLDDDQFLEVRVQWQGGLFADIPPRTQEIVVDTGESEVLVFEDITKNPGEESDTLRIEIRDQNDDVIETEFYEVF